MMTTLAEFREQNPAYANVPDDELADELFNRHYVDEMPREQFDEMVGYTPSVQRQYENALANVRQTQFPGMSDENWEQYSQRAFAPDLMTQSQQSSTLGFADEIGAAMGGLGSQVRQWTGGGGPGFGESYADLYDLEQARLALARENNGWAGTAVEIGSGLAALGPGRTAAGQLPRLAIGPTQPAAQTGSRWVNAMKEGAPAAGVGAIYGFGSTDGDLAQRAIGSAGGASIGVLGSAVAQPVAKTVEAVTRRAAGIPAWLANRAAVSEAVRAAPTAAAIKAGSEGAYKAAADSGALIAPKAMGQLRQNIRETLDYQGMILPSGNLSGEYPKLTAAMQALDELVTGNTSVAQAQTLLRRLQRIEKSADAGEAQIGSELVAQLEDFMSTLPPSAFAKGNGQLVAQQWAKGRSDLALGDKVGTIEEAIEDANISADGFVEGLKGEFRSILKSPEKQRPFGADELAQMRKFIEGGPFPNFVASVGKDPSVVANLLGQLTGIPGGGFTTGAAGMAAGAGARHLSDAGARRAAERLRAAAATPGGLPQLPAAPPPSEFQGIGVPAALVLNPGGETVRDEVLRLLVQE